MKYDEQYMQDLMHKYNVTIVQMQEIIEKIYTQVVRETYNNDSIYIKLEKNNIYIYDEHNRQLELPTPTSSMAFTLKKLLINELINTQQINEYEEFCNNVGKLYQVKINNILNNKLIVSIENKYFGEITMPPTTNMRDYRIGSYVYALLEKIYNNSYLSDGVKKHGRQLVFENISNTFIYELIKHFIPYIANNIVQINNIARIPGKRTKIVVSSSDPHINAASICIGKGGEITKKLYEALNGEYVDMINEANDLESKIKSYCKPYNVVYIKTMGNNSIKIVLDNRHEANMFGLINKINITLLNRLLFHNQKMHLTFRTEDEYRQDIAQSQQQLYQLLVSEGISEKTSESLVNKFLELNDLIFITGISMDENDTNILNKITEMRKKTLKNEFIDNGGEDIFFEYVIHRFTRDEFIRLQIANIISFQDIIEYNPIELAQVMGLDISFTTTLLQEIKQIIAGI